MESLLLSIIDTRTSVVRAFCIFFRGLEREDGCVVLNDGKQRGAFALKERGGLPHLARASRGCCGRLLVLVGIASAGAHRVDNVESYRVNADAEGHSAKLIGGAICLGLAFICMYRLGSWVAYIHDEQVYDRALYDLLKHDVATQKYPFDENLDHIIGQLLANLGAPHLFTREVDFVATLILKHVSQDG